MEGESLSPTDFADARSCADFRRLEASAIEEVIVTNTVPVEGDKKRDKITVLSVANIFAEAIRRIHHRESVGAMLN